MKTQNLEVVLGQEVESPTYGKGYVTEIQGDAITVRFWKRGYKTFHKPEGDYPFVLLDEVRPVEQKSLVERVLARETHAEKKERSRRCQHRENRHLCLKCAGLTESEIKKWNRYRTRGRRINRGSSVSISRMDCVLVSRPESTVPGTDSSYWFECLDCKEVIEVPASKEKLTLCPTCGGTVTSVSEPFQRTQFSPYIGDGAREQNYRTALRVRARHTEEEESKADIARDLFTDPNSRFQKGGTGYLHIPLDAPRSTRADAPEWLECRASFLQTLRKSRSERAERILHGFYVEKKTDEQIAESEGWAKDSIKNERKQLLERGNHFFRLLGAKHPPSPAINERYEDHPHSHLLRGNHGPGKTLRESPALLHSQKRITPWSH